MSYRISMPKIGDIVKIEYTSVNYYNVIYLKVTCIEKESKYRNFPYGFAIGGYIYYNQNFKDNIGKEVGIDYWLFDSLEIITKEQLKNELMILML